MDVRKGLRKTLSNKKIFSDKYWTTDQLSGNKHWVDLSPSFYRIPITNKHRIISSRSINDYIRIDDFYTKLDERNSYIENNQTIDDIALLKLNKKCLELAEEALMKIDWSIYKN
jgi:hypothetical protein